MLNAILSDLHEKQLLPYDEIGRNRFRQLINAIQNKGYKVVITSTVRPLNENSRHSKKRAIDLNIIDESGNWYKMDTPKEKWMKTGVPQIAVSMDFRWGGNFTTPWMHNGILNKAYDPLHFDFS